MVDTARRAVAELAASQHRAFTRRQAAELDFDSRRIATGLSSGWLREPVPGVLVLTDGAVTWQQRLMVVVLASNGKAVAAYRSAARLHRLDGFDSPGNAVLEVAAHSGCRFRVPTKAVVHHVAPLDAVDITKVDGIPCVKLPRALAELGCVVKNRNAVRRALTSARRRGVDLAVVRDTAERLHRPGQRGTGTLLRLLDAVPWEGRLPQTWFEELLALCLDDPTLPPIVPQCPIRDSTGRIVARTDLGMPSIRLGLEAHSRRYHFGPDAEALDEDRDIAAAACGWELLYIGWYATQRPADVLAVVRQVARVRSRELHSGEL
jgi:hypothetical protein